MIASETVAGLAEVAELGREGTGAEGEHEPRDALDGSQEGAGEAVAGDRLAQEGEGDDGDGGGGEDGGDLVGDLVVLLHDVVHALSLDLLYPSRVGDGEMLITTVPIVWAVIEDAVVAVRVTGLEIRRGSRHGKDTITSTGGDPPRGSWSGVRWRPRSDGTRRARPGESRCGPCGWWASRRRERPVMETVMAAIFFGSKAWTGRRVGLQPVAGARMRADAGRRRLKRGGWAGGISR